MAVEIIDNGQGSERFVLTGTRATGAAALDPHVNLQAGAPAVGLMLGGGTGPAGLGAAGTGGGLLVPVKQFKVTTANTGPTAAITAVANTKLTILTLEIQEQTDANTAVLVSFVDTGTPTAIPGAPSWAFRNLGGVGRSAPTAGFLFQCPTGTGMQVNLNTNTSSVMVQGTYIEAPA